MAFASANGSGKDHSLRSKVLRLRRDYIMSGLLVMISNIWVFTASMFLLLFRMEHAASRDELSLYLSLWDIVHCLNVD